MLKWYSCLACWDPRGSKCTGTRTVSAAGVMALPESFFEPLVAGNQKASLASLSLKLCAFKHLEGSLAWGPLCRSAHQALKGAPWVGSYPIVQCIRYLMSQSLLCTFQWRRKWQPTPVFMPGWRSQVGCCPWGRTESDMTEST